MSANNEFNVQPQPKPAERDLGITLVGAKLPGVAGKSQEPNLLRELTAGPIVLLDDKDGPPWFEEGKICELSSVIYDYYCYTADPTYINGSFSAHIRLNNEVLLLWDNGERPLIHKLNDAKAKAFLETIQGSCRQIMNMGGGATYLGPIPAEPMVFPSFEEGKIQELEKSSYETLHSEAIWRFRTLSVFANDNEFVILAWERRDRYFAKRLSLSDTRKFFEITGAR